MHRRAKESSSTYDHYCSSRRPLLLPLLLLPNVGKSCQSKTLTTRSRTRLRVPCPSESRAAHSSLILGHVVRHVPVPRSLALQPRATDCGSILAIQSALRIYIIKPDGNRPNAEYVDGVTVHIGLARSRIKIERRVSSLPVYRNRQKAAAPACELKHHKNRQSPSLFLSLALGDVSEKYPKTLALSFIGIAIPCVAFPAPFEPCGGALHSTVPSETCPESAQKGSVSTVPKHRSPLLWSVSVESVDSELVGL